MKKIVMFSTFVFGSLFAQNSMANTAEDVLKRSCLKDNPLVVGESDPTLLSIYAQACDKKNKENVNRYLVEAAERFQQLGSNWKALQLVHSLQAKNIQSNTLTDVKFMASASMANNTIEQMRTREARYLNEDATYPVAKALVDSINSARPASIMIESVKTPISTTKSGGSKTGNAGTKGGGKTGGKTGNSGGSKNGSKVGSAGPKTNTTTTNKTNDPFEDFKKKKQ